MKVTLSKKSKIILILAVIFVVFGSFLGYIFLKSKKESLGESREDKSKEEARIIRYPCPLDGRWVTDESKTQRHPLAVAVENHPDARPQSGLNKADIVYEALAEGGITRFLAFYLCQDAQEIGPVRSARGYFLDWLSPYNALYVHCGGSPESLRLISYYGIRNLNQFYNDQYFWRVNWRYAPHNLYTNTEHLFKAVKDKSFKTPSYKSYKFKEDPDNSFKGSKSKIQINYAGYNFVVKYNYDKKSNTYLRFQGGIPFKDKITGKQIAPKNVVVIWVKSWSVDVHGRLSMETTGQGEALVFLDGQAAKANWKKSSRTDELKFYDKNKKEMIFNRGSIWIQVVPVGTKVNYLIY